MTQVIFNLEGKISRLDQRSLQVFTDCQDLLNTAIETLVEIFQFQEETKEEIFKRGQEEWRKEKELLLKEKKTALIKAETEKKAIYDLELKFKTEKKALSDLLLAEKNKPKVCGAGCTKDHTNDGACLVCLRI